MMTAASGGNRESLLGQWPARRKCFLSTKRMLGAATRKKRKPFQIVYLQHRIVRSFNFFTLKS